MITSTMIICATILLHTGKMKQFDIGAAVTLCGIVDVLLAWIVWG